MASGSELISCAFWKLSNSFEKSLQIQKVFLWFVTMQAFWLWSLLRWLLRILHQYKMLSSQGWVLEAGKTPPVRSWSWKASKKFPYTWNWNKVWVLYSQDEFNLHWSVGSSCERWLETVTYDARERPFFFKSINSPAVQCLGDTGSEEPC